MEQTPKIYMFILMSNKNGLQKIKLSYRKDNSQKPKNAGSAPGKSTANNADNILKLLALLTKYDLTLDNHLWYEKRNELYLSHDGQNDLIQLLASEILSIINDEVKITQFFSIDSTIDISRINQMPVSLRLVSKSDNVMERFIGFYTTEYSNAVAFADLPQLHILQEHQKRLNKSTVDTLKQLSDKRLASRKHADDAVVEPFFAILAALDDINLVESKEHIGSVKAEAIALSNPSILSETNINSFKNLCETYCNDEEAVVKYETSKDVYASISLSLTTDLQMKDVLPFLVEKQMAPGLPNLSILYKIYLTLPVTSANAERSFSKLKVTKNYLRLTLTNERFSGLSLVSI
ncbi:uncharacterized protein LOC136095766 [Hydra vulgaris]|uniref:uncharacterized protein LOC136095766 n=1 Tax=Hydra vulgaris TaxID=6087 RepID=UPI0032E9F120